MAKGYRHLTYNQRCQIFALMQNDNYYSQARIANILNISQSAISRVLSRNSGKNGYDPEEAHAKATARRSEANTGTIKLTHEVKAYIYYQLTKEQWSPEQISGRDIEKNCGVKLSHESIYQYIWDDKQRGLIPNRVGIEERPEIAEMKERFGDFEVDTIVGANHQGAILSVQDH